MTDFPRDVLPRRVTDFSFPGALMSQAQSGKITTRDAMRVGRVWEEEWLLNVSEADARELLALVRKWWRSGTAFDIVHQDYTTMKGIGGGSAVVDGGSQTGSSLAIRSGPTSVTGWLKAGDIFTIANVNTVYDVTADVNTDGSGDATIPISPPIWTAPTDGWALTITGVKVHAVIAGPPEFPASGADNFGLLRVAFTESP